MEHQRVRDVGCLRDASGAGALEPPLRELGQGRRDDLDARVDAALLAATFARSGVLVRFQAVLNPIRPIIAALVAEHGGGG